MRTCALFVSCMLYICLKQGVLYVDRIFLFHLFISVFSLKFFHFFWLLLFRKGFSCFINIITILFNFSSDVAFLFFLKINFLLVYVEQFLGFFLMHTLWTQLRNIIAKRSIKLKVTLVSPTSERSELWNCYYRNNYEITYNIRVCMLKGSIFI